MLLPTNLAITSYTHKPWHRRYFLNREPSYWLQSSVTGSAFRGVILVLQNNSMLQDTQMSRSNMGAFRCIHTRNPSSPSWLNEVKVALNGHCALIGYSHNRCDRIGCKIQRALMKSHPFFIVGPEHSRSQGSARANRIICRISWESFANVKSTYECLTITTNALPSIRIYCDAYENHKNMLS